MKVFVSQLRSSDVTVSCTFFFFFVIIVTLFMWRQPLHIVVRGLLKDAAYWKVMN